MATSAAAATAAASPADAGSFLAGVGASFLLKLATSVDDLIWFSPFLALSQSRAEKVRFSAIYLLVCVLVATAALGLARAAAAGFDLAANAIASATPDADAAWEDGEEARGFWDAARILGASAAAVVFVHALVELRDWLREGHEFPSLRRIFPGTRNTHRCRSPVDELDGDLTEYRADEGTAGVANVDAKSPDGERSPQVPSPNDAGGNADAEDMQRASNRSAGALLSVALAGTLDDLVLFAAVVAGRGLPWAAVLPGSFLAALTILFVCWHAARYAPFADFVRIVPLWALLGGIAIYLLAVALI